ncbi:MAG: hypothetical protein GYA62_15325 [Bacteroidales bacterium]|nr:hypothetical protein [Bacteroidales bacterium]
MAKKKKGGLFRRAGSKVKEAAKKTGSKVKGAAGKVKEAAKKTVNKLKEAGGFAILLPFKLAMRKLIVSKGKTPETNFDKLCLQFKAVVIDGKESFEMQTLESLDPVTVTVVISAITGFFKALRDKKKSGKELTKFENEALQLAEEGSEIIKDEIRTEAKLSAFNPLIIILAVLIVFFVFRK